VLDHAQILPIVDLAARALLMIIGRYAPSLTILQPDVLRRLVYELSRAGQPIDAA
jgi:hypothetical protein